MRFTLTFANFCDCEDSFIRLPLGLNEFVGTSLAGLVAAMAATSAVTGVVDDSSSISLSLPSCW